MGRKAEQDFTLSVIICQSLILSTEVENFMYAKRFSFLKKKKKKLQFVPVKMALNEREQRGKRHSEFAQKIW